MVVPPTDRRLKIATKDGESLVKMKSGASYFRGKDIEHDVINGSDGDYAFIETELK